MDHTYLRYEAADTFGLTVAAGSSKSNQIIVADQDSVLTTTGSCVTVSSLKSGQVQSKYAHSVGNGGLNSDEVVCLSVSVVGGKRRVATGWVDGAVRVFEDPRPASFSLLDNDEPPPEPLVLKGSDSVIRALCWEDESASQSRLASGAADGRIVLWDVLAETGLFALRGHKAAITGLSFRMSCVMSSSLDGHVKIWDLTSQACVQTLVGAGVALSGLAHDRLVTGGNDGVVQVWSVNENHKGEQQAAEQYCQCMGKLVPPPNVAVSHDSCAAIHVQGNYVGVLQSNSKTIDVYVRRNEAESQRKRQRRLKRRQEKQNKKVHEPVQRSKRGVLDDEDDDPDSQEDTKNDEADLDPESLKASDEFEYIATVRSNHKIRDFCFARPHHKKEILRLVAALVTNALEIHSLTRQQLSQQKESIVVAEKQTSLDFLGHPSGIRSIALSSDDRLACTVSKSFTKIWNVASRQCIQSVSPSSQTGPKTSYYGLCAAFLPGNTHVAVGTREGHLLLLDITAGLIVYVEQGAHDGAIWGLDLRRRSPGDDEVIVVTGSADKTVKFWTIEAQEEENGEYIGQPMFVQTRLLKMTDDVVAVKFSKLPDSSKRMVFVSTLDSTVKVFFESSLKMFLSLYGHKLPALAVDCSDDDILLASAGADKTVKLWGLDFGDTHRTLHGHDDSITDVRFLNGTHNFFTASKDRTVRYWDGDRFEQILLLNGHFAEVNCLAIGRTGAFVLSSGMDRNVRVWERTRDIVFLEEEREKEMEKVFDRVNTRDGDTAQILERRRGEDGEEDDTNVSDSEGPQTEAAVRQSIVSVAAGDRIMEAIERADEELREIALFRKANGLEKTRPLNVMMMGLEPAPYVLWVLRTIKSAEMEQSLVLLSLRHIERLFFYLVVLLRAGQAVELCSRVAVFLVTTHKNQIVASTSMRVPLQELKRLLRLRLSESRDVIGFDLAAMKLICKVANDRKLSISGGLNVQQKDVWAGLGLGSDIAAALEGRSKKR